MKDTEFEAVRRMVDEPSDVDGALVALFDELRERMASASRRVDVGDLQREVDK